jgi:GntR family transcriptional regulator
MSPEIQRRPPYQQIADHYRAQITSGDLPDGTRLPGSRELAEQWRTTPNTAARALTRLQAEGLIRVLPTGAVVTAADLTTFTPRDRVQSAMARGKIYPPSERTKVIAAELVQAPEHVADALGIDPRIPVVRRSRITLHGDLPVTLSTSWLPADLATAAPALLDTARIEGGTVGLIRELTGRKIVSGHDQLCARGATADVARDLSIGEGAPVLYGRNWWADVEGAVVEYGEFWVPADRMLTYSYSLD